MRRRTALFAVLAVFAAMFAAGGPATAQIEPSDRAPGTISGDFTPRSLDEIVHVFIQLDEPSVAELVAGEADVSPAEQRAQSEAVQVQQDQVRSVLGDLVVEERSRLVVGANGIRALVRAGDIPAIRATDGVESVAMVTRHYPTNETSVPWIGAGPTNLPGLTGAGVTIAIIDTGIDYTHASFGGSGDPADFIANDPSFIEPGTFPTAKVVDGHDFAGTVYNASDPDENTPDPDPDPLDGNGHGTHVAGSAAGFETIEVGAGVAPDALLYALKVFGDVAGSTDLVSEAIEFALDPNEDGSMDDAVDVINMSLGSDFGHPNDPSAISSQNAVEAGVTVVIAAGNAGPAPYVLGSPSVAPDAISVAASIDGGVTVLAMPVNSPPSVAGDYEAQPGDFGSLSPDTTGDLIVAEPLDACEPVQDMTGQIAFIQRGTCEFGLKIRHAQDAGAIGAVVFNNVEGPPIVMAPGATTPVATIPAVMISLEDGETLLAAAATDTVNVTLTDDVEISKPELGDTMASFTSRGPGFDSIFKPEISAPGFSIFSAEVGGGTAGTLSSGTSMATPHVAGVAALLIEQDGTRAPEVVKSLIMNSARPALTDPPGGTVDLAIQGNGVVQADHAALDVGAYTTPAAVSFGRINPTTTYNDSATIGVTRMTGNATYDVDLVPNQTEPGVTWDVSAASVTTTGGSGSFDVSISVDPDAMGADPGFFSQRESDGWIVLTNQGDSDDVMRVGLMAVVDPAATVAAAGGAGAVNLTNDGPSSGPAEGFTSVGVPPADSLAEVGYRTADAGDGPYRTIDFGMALSTAWSSPSAQEVDIFLDVDEDGVDEYVLVAADLGLLLGADPEGVLATALFDLELGGGFLLYIADGDLNDRVAVLPADLTGDFGFLADGDSTFTMTVAVFDQLGLSGLSDPIAVDLGTEITSADGLSVSMAAGAATEVDVDGTGDTLWLFANNAVPGQVDIASVTAITEPPPPEPPPPPPPPGEPPSFDDVPEDHLFYTEIIWLAEEGITRGCNPPANTLFCPDDNVSRGQMAAFLNRALDLAATDEDFFVDDDENIFEGDINKLAAAGITRGCNPPINDEFCPERFLSRAEMATFMVRGFEFTEGVGADLFVDDDGNIHESAIDILGTAEVTRGCNPPTNDEYCPDRLITRGEMAAFIFRAYAAAGLGD